MCLRSALRENRIRITFALLRLAFRWTDAERMPAPRAPTAPVVRQAKAIRMMDVSTEPAFPWPDAEWTIARRARSAFRMELASDPSRLAVRPEKASTVAMVQ